MFINHGVKQKRESNTASQFTVQRSQAKIHLNAEEGSCSIQDPAQVRNYMHNKLDSLPEFCTVRLGSQELCLM